MTFTGTDLYRIAVAWQKLPAEQKATWTKAAHLHIARGEKTSPQAEFMAARLKRLVAREGKK